GVFEHVARGGFRLARLVRVEVALGRGQEARDALQAGHAARHVIVYGS
ncbi:MAG: hypothetical protein GY946_02485, partial [bacterium]|nr:hypothetical protein [bacterium]